MSLRLHALPLLGLLGLSGCLRAGLEPAQQDAAGDGQQQQRERELTGDTGFVDRSLAEAGQSDAAPPSDSTPWPVSTRQYVVSSLRLPGLVREQESFDLTGDGLPNNDLGLFFQAATFALGPDLLQQMQQSIDQMILTGQLITLIELESSFADGATLSAKVGPGEPTTCCQHEPLGDCPCYNGAGSFGPHPEIAPSSLAGKVAFTDFEPLVGLRPGQLPLRLILFGAAEGRFLLERAQIQGSLAQTDSLERIINGKLGGVILAADLQEKLFPFFAEVFSTLCVNNAAGLASELQQQFGGDCAITADELTANSYVQTMLSLLPDINGDGQKDFTLGLGLTAVQAQISW